MKKKDPLKAYRRKRHFDRTTEPAGNSVLPRSKQRIFVVQKHDASRLHYDFRIEVGGVLKSWAIPKGPSTNPRDKRLAVPTEDHPIEYARFEGVIPEGEYGAGVVIVWDIGVYRNLSEKNGNEIPIEDALRLGLIKIWLDGKKLKGGYALTRISTKPARWLLVKMKDNYADDTRNIMESEPQSPLSGKTVEELRHEAARMNLNAPALTVFMTSLTTSCGIWMKLVSEPCRHKRHGLRDCHSLQEPSEATGRPKGFCAARPKGTFFHLSIGLPHESSVSLDQIRNGIGDRIEKRREILPLNSPRTH